MIFKFLSVSCPSKKFFVVYILAVFVVLAGCGTTNYSQSQVSSRQLHFATGLAYESLGDYLRAEVRYRRVLQAPEPYFATKSDTDLGARSQLRLARIYANHLNKPDSAAAAYRKFVSEYATGKARETVLFELGQYLQGEEKFERAAEIYSKLIDQFPASGRQPEFHYNLAEVYLQLGRREAAVGQFNYLIDSFPESGLVDGAYYNLAGIYGERGELQAQLESYRGLIENRSESDLRPYSLLRAVEIADKLGNRSLARKLFEKMQESVENEEYLGRAKNVINQNGTEGNE